MKNGINIENLQKKYTYGEIYPIKLNKVNIPKEDESPPVSEKNSSINYIDFNVFNSRKFEGKIITAEMVDQMKIYFTKFFSATEHIIKDIFTVKNNIIQHPIYPLRGGCFICNEKLVLHLKDHNSPLFFAKKKIKLIKNANIFELLNNSDYNEEEIFEENEYIEEENENHDDGDTIIANNQDHMDSNEYINENDILNFRLNELISDSYYSDSNYEFAKINYRQDDIDIKQIKIEIEKTLNDLNSDNNLVKNMKSGNFNDLNPKKNRDSFKNFILFTKPIYLNNDNNNLESEKADVERDGLTQHDNKENKYRRITNNLISEHEINFKVFSIICYK